MTSPTAAMLVIGDEILSGRTRDSNMHFLARALTDHGIRLAEARVVADEHDRIKGAVQTLSAGHDHLFTSGGIGPTHDDITADAVADAMGTAIGIRDDARALLQAHYDRQGQALNAARLRMARIPEGASLIDNPISAAPGFTLGNVHVMAGVPTIFEAMVASVMPTLTGGPQMLSQSLRILRGEGASLIDNPISAAPGFTLGNVHVMAGVPTIFEAMVASVMPTLTGGPQMLSQSLRIVRGEGDIAEALGRLATDHPEVSIGSYPFHRDGVHGSNVVVRSQNGAAVDAVMAELGRMFPDAG